MKKYSVYLLVNLNNGRKYFGMSGEIQKRWKHHRGRLNNHAHANKELQKDFDKGDKLSYKILVDNLTFSEAEQIEEEYIKNNLDIAYNLILSGKKFRTHSEDTINKISLSKRNKTIGEDNHFYGKKHSPETIQKIKESLSKIDRGGGNNAFARSVFVNGKEYSSVKEGIQASGLKKYSFCKKLRDENYNDIRYIS